MLFSAQCGFHYLALALQDPLSCLHCCSTLICPKKKKSCCRWWDSVALPEDVDSCDEDTFRQQIRDLALTVIMLSHISFFWNYIGILFTILCSETKLYSLARQLKYKNGTQEVVIVLIEKCPTYQWIDGQIIIFCVSQSLQLLKDAIFDSECAPCILFGIY